MNQAWSIEITVQVQILDLKGVPNLFLLFISFFFTYIKDRLCQSDNNWLEKKYADTNSIAQAAFNDKR